MKSEQTLAAILKAAFAISLRQGVHNLTLGDVASALNISKSGVFLRAGSLEALQMLVVDEHERSFHDSVVEPALKQPAGLPRLDALVRLWIERCLEMRALVSSHYAAAEIDPDLNSDPLRTRLIESMLRWRETLECVVAGAAQEGHLRSDTDPKQFSFELFAIMAGFMYDAHVLRRDDARNRAVAGYLRFLSTYTRFG